MQTRSYADTNISILSRTFDDLKNKDSIKFLPPLNDVSVQVRSKSVNPSGDRVQKKSNTQMMCQCKFG